ncbi:hypothetical protein LDENG_00138430 [Lucifuga dentata]|nr:hypothetical protein LDENG_00138430 [Lucifuga dentata]
MEVWKVGKTFLIHRSSSMLWEMIVTLRSNMQNGWYGPLNSTAMMGEIRNTFEFQHFQAQR